MWSTMLSSIFLQKFPDFYTSRNLHVHNICEHCQICTNWRPTFKKVQHMWCNQAEWVLCRALSNFSLVVHLGKYSESFGLLKTSSKSDLRFQRYIQFCVAENNKKQKEFHTIMGCISKSIFPTYDSFRLITTSI